MGDTGTGAPSRAEETLMATKAAEIQHRIDQIDDLLNRMREAYNEPVKSPGQVNPTPDVVDTEPARVSPDGPAHRYNVNPARQYDDNMAMAGLANPEAFGRNRDGAKVVVKSSESTHDYRPPPQTTPGSVGLRAPRPGARPSPAPTEETDLPPWERHGVTGKTVAEAVSFIEGQAREASVNPTTTGAVNELKEKPAAGELPPEQLYFDATAAKSLPHDVTNPGFEYQKGESAYDDWVKQHTPGLEVQAGQGKPIADDKYGITVTLAVPHRTKGEK
jgi:hypothetical protein